MEAACGLKLCLFLQAWLLISFSVKGTALPPHLFTVVHEHICEKCNLDGKTYGPVELYSCGHCFGKKYMHQRCSLSPSPEIGGCDTVFGLSLHALSEQTEGDVTFVFKQCFSLIERYVERLEENANAIIKQKLLLLNKEGEHSTKPESNEDGHPGSVEQKEKNAGPAVLRETNKVALGLLSDDVKVYQTSAKETILQGYIKRFNTEKTATTLEDEAVNDENANAAGEVVVFMLESLPEELVPEKVFEEMIKIIQPPLPGSLDKPRNLSPEQVRKVRELLDTKLDSANRDLLRCLMKHAQRMKKFILYRTDASMLSSLLTPAINKAFSDKHLAVELAVTRKCTIQASQASNTTQAESEENSVQSPMLEGKSSLTEHLRHVCPLHKKSKNVSKPAAGEHKHDESPQAAGQRKHDEGHLWGVSGHRLHRLNTIQRERTVANIYHKVYTGPTRLPLATLAPGTGLLNCDPRYPDTPSAVAPTSSRHLVVAKKLEPVDESKGKYIWQGFVVVQSLFNNAKVIYTDL